MGYCVTILNRILTTNKLDRGPKIYFDGSNESNCWNLSIVSNLKFELYSRYYSKIQSDFEMALKWCLRGIIVAPLGFQLVDLPKLMKNPLDFLSIDLSDFQLLYEVRSSSRNRFWP